MPANDSPDNLFVRFKQKVDEHFASTCQRLLGVPTVVSRLNGSWPEPPRPSHVVDHERRVAATSEGEDDAKNTLQPRAAPSLHPRKTVFDLFLFMSPMEALFETERFTESMYQAMWYSFLIESPYSPLRLRKLPQPTPNDLPEGVDATLFGFDDAFEDLLMVSSGQGLPDINERVRFRQECRDSFPRGLPPPLWIHQLTRQGLWYGWEARPEVLDEFVSERWRRWLQEQDDPFHASNRSPPAPSNAAWEDSRARPERRRQVDTEEDSYLSVMGKGLLDATGETSTAAPKPPDAQPTTRQLSTDGLPAGWRVVEKVQESEDANGNAHTTKTVTTFNDKGDEVARRIDRHSEYVWSASLSTAGGGSEKNEDQRQRDGNGRDGDKTGWFWK